MNADPYASYNAFAQPSGSSIGTLFSFPFQVLAAYLWPAPATFARQKAQARWGSLVVLLGFFTVVIGIGAYEWGRWPTLRQGIQGLSWQHVDPRPLSLALVITLALGMLLLSLALAGILHFLAHTQQGQGRYREQLHSILVIGTGPLLLLVAIGLLLSVAPTLGTALRVPLAAGALLLILYSLILLWPSLMGVQQLSAGKAAICLVTLLVAGLLLFFISDLFNDTQNHGGGGGDSNFKRARQRNERSCQRCGFSLQAYDRLHNTPVQFCPKCGQPL